MFDVFTNPYIGGFVNLTYPWGDEFSYAKLNIWEEDKTELEKLEEKRTKTKDKAYNSFPRKNLLTDGYKGNGYNGSVSFLYILFDNVDTMSQVQRQS